MSTEAPVLALNDVRFAYGSRRHGTVEVLAGVDLELARGTITALIGPNGCGKTTMLRIASGMLEADSGTVTGAAAAMMPQADLLLPWAGALDNAALSLRAGGMKQAQARSLATEWFPRLGLDGFERALPHELSGGMRQRVAFARTLLSGREVIALDEPFAALDALTRLEARGWLGSALAESGRTAVVVTHDVDEAVAIASRIVVLTRRPARTLASFDVPAGTSGDPAAALALRTAILEALAVPA